MLPQVIDIGHERGRGGRVRRRGRTVHYNAPRRRLPVHPGDVEGGPQNTPTLYGFQGGSTNDMVLETVRIPTVGLVPDPGRGRGGILSRGGSPVQSTTPTRPLKEQPGDDNGGPHTESPVYAT